jgi:hypothetical protein
MTWVIADKARCDGHVRFLSFMSLLSSPAARTCMHSVITIAPTLPSSSIFLSNLFASLKEEEFGVLSAFGLLSVMRPADDLRSRP